MKRIAIFLLILLLPISARATDYYVSPSGTESWPDCTSPGSPCLADDTETGKDFLGASAGDTVYFLSGTYDPGDAPNWYTPAWNPDNSGSSGNQITFKKYSGTVTITHNTAGPSIGSYGKTYITWDGFSGTKTNIRTFAYLRNADYSIIKNCDITGYDQGAGAENNSCIGLKSANVTVENNKIHGAKGSNWNSCGILLYDTGGTIRYNDIYDNATGIHIKHDNEYLDVYNNFIYSNEIHGIEHQEGWRNINVYKNVFVSNGSVGIENAGSDSPEYQGPAKWYNNTIYDSKGITQNSPVTAINDIEIFNNIIHTSDRGFLIKTAIDNHIVNYHCFYTVTQWKEDDTTYSTFTNWKTTGWDANSIESNPQLFDAGGNTADDYKLTASSPSGCKTGGRGGSYPAYMGAWKWPLDENEQIGYSIGGASPAAALTGTLADGATEAQIVAGGETLIITLTNDTWVATVGDDNAITDALIAGIDSGGEEAHGWDVEVKGNMVHGDVTRTSDTVVTITLGAEAGYAITQNETIAVTVPATALTESESAVVATPTFEITATPDPAAALTGTLADNATEAQIVAGGETLIITLTNDTWVAAGATFDAQRQNIIDGMDSAQSEATGWNAEVRDKEVVGAVVRTNDTTVTITLTASASYDISANESITMTVPASALVTSGDPVVATPDFAIVFFDTSTEEIVGMTLQ